MSVTGQMLDDLTEDAFQAGNRAGLVCGAAIVAWADAIGEIDAVRACPHCRLGTADRVYCEHTMCDPAECHYWVCRPCVDKGLGFDVTTERDSKEGGT